jgi:hypothetical protein
MRGTAGQGRDLVPRNQSSSSRRARARTKAGGGLFTDNIDPAEWAAGDIPWFRRVWQSMRNDPAQRRPTCLFCGARSLIVSYGDNPYDAGRIEVYCDSHDCEAREQIVLVRRDSENAARRADVRALRSVDTAGEPPDMRAYGFSELLSDEYQARIDAERRTVAARRQSTRDPRRARGGDTGANTGL